MRNWDMSCVLTIALGGMMLIPVSRVKSDRTLSSAKERQKMQSIMKALPWLKEDPLILK